MKKHTYKSIALAALAVPFAMSSSVFADTSGSATVNIQVDETLSIVLGSESINFSQADNSLMSRSMTVAGATNAAAGYTISFSANNEYTDLKHTNSNVNASIPTLSENVSAASFPVNHWGYADSLTSVGDEPTNETTFKKVPLSPTNVFATETNGESTHVFTVGVKADNNMASGTYSNDLLFTIVANPVPRNGIESAMIDAGVSSIAVDVVDPVTSAVSHESYYPMQAMSSSICDSAAVNEQFQLVDSRDNKVYWAAKLADGHCWMTQNLDFDLNSAVTLTSEDTNLRQYDTGEGYSANGFDYVMYSSQHGYSYDEQTGVISWTPDASTIDMTAGNYTDWVKNYALPISADPGNWYYTDQFLTPATKNYMAGNGGDYFSQTPFAGNGMHGHVGNYYNWTAAAASNVNRWTDGRGGTYSNIADNPQNSICPKGWRLPTISGDSADVAGSTNEFARLNTLYNGGLLNTSAGLEGAPFYHIRSGVLSDGYVYGMGYGGTYWSSTVVHSMVHYVANIEGNSVNASYSNDNYYGFSVRCIAE